MTLNNQTLKFDPNWITGFVDGEGTFFISIYESSKLKTGFQVRIGFKITQGIKNIQILYNIKTHFGIGHVKAQKTNIYEYRVNDFTQMIEIILPFFNKYALHTTKKFDFLRVLYVSKLMKRKEHLTIEGLAKIRKIRKKMNKTQSIE